MKRLSAAAATVLTVSGLVPSAAEGLRPLARHSDHFFAAQVGADQNGLAAATQPDVAIVRYAGPISSAQRDALREAGLRIIEYIPDHAYLVRRVDGAAAGAGGVPGAAGVLPLRRADKLAPSVLRMTQRGAVAGWGRVDLRPLVAPPPAAVWYDDHASGLATAETYVYDDGPATPLFVADGSQPLVVTLVWTDPPASLSATTTLVNDLDLEVLGPGGTPYRGNGVPTGDRLNNVEGVIVPSPPLGAYMVTVRAHNVPIASQPYALVVRGGLESDVIFEDGFEG